MKRLHTRLGLAGLLAPVFFVIGSQGCATQQRVGSVSSPGDAVLAVDSRVVGEAKLEYLPPSNYPVVTVYGNRTSGRMIFDTGGNGTILITMPFLFRLGDNVSQPRILHVGNQQQQLYGISGLSLGPAMGLGDVPAIMTGLEGISLVCGDKPLDGVLTVTGLSNLDLDCDMPNAALRLRPASDASDFGASVKDAMKIERPIGRGQDDRPFAVLKIGTRDVPALMDTGSYDAFTIPEQFLVNSGVTLENERSSVGTGGFNTAPQRSRRGTIPVLKLGPITVRNAQVNVVPHNMPEVVVGAPVVNRYRMLFNMRTRNLYVVGPSELESPAVHPDVLKRVEGISAAVVK